jgi:RNA-directed DNA polymerase
LRRFGAKLVQLPGGRGQNLKEFIKKDLNPLLRGWANYFKLVEVTGPLTGLDGWIRRKLRCIIWRQQKRPRTRLEAMVKEGANPNKAREIAWGGKGPWRCAKSEGMHQAYSNEYFEKLGLCSLLLQEEMAM